MTSIMAGYACSPLCSTSIVLPGRQGRRLTCADARAIWPLGPVASTVEAAGGGSASSACS